MKRQLITFTIFFFLFIVGACTSNIFLSTVETSNNDGVLANETEISINSTMMYTGIIIETENVNKPDYITAYEDIDITEAEIHLLIIQEIYVAACEAERVEMVNNLMVQLSTEGTEVFPYPVIPPNGWHYDELDGVIVYEYIGGGTGEVVVRDNCYTNPT